MTNYLTFERGDIFRVIAPLRGRQSNFDWNVLGRSISDFLRSLNANPKSHAISNNTLPGELPVPNVPYRGFGAQYFWHLVTKSKFIQGQRRLNSLPPKKSCNIAK